MEEDGTRDENDHTGAASFFLVYISFPEAFQSKKASLSFTSGALLTQTTGLSFPFQQAQDVSLTDGSLDVSDDGPSGTGASLGVHEFDTDLCHVTGVTGTAQHSVDLGKLDGLILCCGWYSLFVVGRCFVMWRHQEMNNDIVRDKTFWYTTHVDCTKPSKR